MTRRTKRKASRLILVLILLLILSGLLLLMRNALAQSVSPEKPTQITQPIVQAHTPTNAEWLAAINAERQKAGVAPLIERAELDSSAQRKASEMDLEGLDSTPHENNQGIHGYTYGHELMPQCTEVSENIVWNYSDLNKAVAGWMNSAPHRAAILNPIYTYTGFGHAGIFEVEHFCSVN